jgi:putative ABC transport system permease protein
LLRLLRHVSVRQLTASWGRTVLIVGGVATGVSLIVAIRLINSSVLTSFRRSIELAAGPAALEVTLGVGEIGFDESAAEIVRSDPDVQFAVPLVRGTVSLSTEPGETLQLFGADLTAEADLNRYPITTQDRAAVLRGLEDPSSILLSATFAEAHSLRVGQKVSLATTSGITLLTIRGLLEATGVAAVLGGRLAVMDLPAAQFLLGKAGKVDQVDIVLRDGAHTETVQRRVAAMLPDTLTVQRPEQRGAHYDQILSAFQGMLTGLSSLCLVAGLFIIYNTTSTGALRRAAVMGELRLLGAEESRLFRLLLAEAAVLGVLGSMVGMGSGIVLARLLTGMVADSMGVIFQLRFPIEQLAIDPTEQLTIGALGLAAAIFGSYFAARRASRVEPLDTVRGELLSAVGTVSIRRLTTWWILLVFIATVFIALQVQRKSFVWGNLGSTLWNASVLVIAVPVVSWAALPLHHVLSRLFGIEGRFAVESLLRSRTRTGICVAAVALVLAVGITVSTLAMSFRKSVTSYFEEGFFQGDLIVSAVATEGGWLETPLPESLADEVRAMPGVRQVDTMRALFGQMYRGERIAVVALSDGFLTSDRFGARWYVDGDAAHAAAALRAGQGVSVSANLVDRFGLRVGDLLELDTPSGRLQLPIAGVIRDFVSDRGTVAVGRRLFVERWREPTVNRVHVHLSPNISAEMVRQRIVAQLGAQYRLKILSLEELIRYQVGAVDRAFAFTHAIQLLIVIVTIAGIADLLIANIVERSRELSLWQVIGADKRSVGRSIVIESATIGGLGALLGIGVGLVTAWIWLRFNFRYLVGFALDYHFATAATLWYVLLVMVVTVGVGYWAGRFATGRTILDGLRAEAGPAL